MTQDHRPRFVLAASVSIILLAITLGFGVWLLVNGNPFTKQPVSIEQATPGVVDSSEAD